MITIVIEKLPHGSGIDAEWTYDDMGSYAKLCNSFHCMNEWGYYVGWADFSVIVPYDSPLDFRLHFHGSRSQYLNRRYMLRDYLEDIIGYALEQMMTKEVA